MEAMSGAALNLAELDDPDKWVFCDDVPVFDEHDEHQCPGCQKGMSDRPFRCQKCGQASRLVRRFGKVDLEEIAAGCNVRDGQGNLCPLTIGHMADGVPEKQQPELVGYARKFWVGYHPGLKRNVILARYQVRKDRYDDARTYPRSSVELWLRDRFIDPIALLRRTPQRDLGQWVYSKGGDKLCYSMEASMDPAKPPDANDPDAEMCAKFIKACSE